MTDLIIMTVSFLFIFFTVWLVNSKSKFNSRGYSKIEDLQNELINPNSIFNQAINALDIEEYDKAESLLRSAAKRGNPVARLALKYLLSNQKRELDEDCKDVNEWGDSEEWTQIKLKIFYLVGMPAKDNRRAFEYYRKCCLGPKDLYYGALGIVTLTGSELGYDNVKLPSSNKDESYQMVGLEVYFQDEILNLVAMAYGKDWPVLKKDDLVMCRVVDSLNQETPIFILVCKYRDCPWLTAKGLRFQVEYPEN